MKNYFDRLNDEKINLSEFEGDQLTDIEKKAIKKRIRTKLKGRSGHKRRLLAVVASLAAYNYYRDEFKIYISGYTSHWKRT